MPKTFIRELREVGFRSAWRRFIERRHLRTLAYILLAVAVVIAIASSRQQNSQQTQRLKAATATVLKASCNSGNDLRKTLRSILEHEPAQIAAQVKSGRITPAEGASDTTNLHHDIKLLAAKNCDSFVGAITRSK